MTDELTTEEVADALRIAHEMVTNGIAVFAAYPCPENCPRPKDAVGGFHLPKRWQQTAPSHASVDRWKPGMALAAVGGNVADWLDEDPRSNGHESVASLRERGIFPETYGISETPSGGRHYTIAPLYERETNLFMPGLDYQGGDMNGEGRAFVFLPPTVKRSKGGIDGTGAGEMRPYRWITPPDLSRLREAALGDRSGDEVRRLIKTRQESKSAKSSTPPAQPTESSPFVSASDLEKVVQHGEVIPAQTVQHTPESPFVSASQVYSSQLREGVREFTEDAAFRFVQPSLDRLRRAVIGEIEEQCNAAASNLSHFVPEFVTVDEAYAILSEALSHTAYDPYSPHSAWDVSKFIPVLNGSRPLRDPWKARKLADVPEALRVESVAPPADAVAALLAEMKTPEEVAEQPAPVQLIEGLLTLDSETWLIGAPGSKKSFEALHMIGCIATGRPYRGLETRQGPMVFIVAEGSGGTGPRVKAWLKTYGAMVGPQGERMVYVLPRPVQAADIQAWSVLVEACRQIEPVMVVIDTQARVTVGLDENSAKEIGHYIDAVSAMRRATTACVFTIHHTGRNGLDARGSSAIDGAQGTELKIVADQGDKMRGELRVEKQKDLREREPLPLAFASVEVGVDEKGRPVTSLVAVESSAFEIAAGLPPSIDSERVAITEPSEEWLLELGKESVLRQRILQALWQVGQGDGLTLSDARLHTAARWYGGKVIRRSAEGEGLIRASFDRCWKGLITQSLEVSDEPPVLIRTGGQRWGLNPELVPDMSEK